MYNKKFCIYVLYEWNHSNIIKKKFCCLASPQIVFNAFLINNFFIIYLFDDFDGCVKVGKGYLIDASI